MARQCAVAAMLAMVSASVLGQTVLGGQRSTLNELADFADRMCTTAPLQGEKTRREFSANAEVELQKLLKVLIGAGVEGAAKYQRSSYAGVLQKDLVSAMRSSNDCKLAVLRELKDTLLPAASPVRKLPPAATRTTTTTQAFADRYVDGKVRLASDRPNIAVHLLALPGYDISGLAEAARNALSEDGYNVVPLFKRRLSQDRLDLQLYEGSASLLEKLAAKKYCDHLVFGKVRTTRAPALVGGGVFVAEVRLTLRAVATASGEILDEFAISEKGGGATAEASIVDSLRRLEATVRERLPSWTW